MFRHLMKFIFLTACFLAISPNCTAEPQNYRLESAKDYQRIQVKVARKILLPKWYHEGLFYDGKSMWVANGKKGKIWVVDIPSGSVGSEITPIAGFTEGITKLSDDTYFTTDWDEEKLYRARIRNDKFIPESEISLAPEHPAGVVWTGNRLFVITWLRGMTGTKFYLLEMDKNGQILRRTRISRIEEPAHMAWDGENLWITSWYSKLVYKVDVNNMKILGSFTSPVPLATGIAWDGKYIWLTGTYGGLYQVEVAPPQEGEGMEIKVTSPVFKDGEMIPRKYTCDGQEVSPALSWSGLPSGTKSVALISDDPDAPAGTWVHWVIFNIPPGENGLPEGVPSKEVLPNGAGQGINDSHKIGYDAPCPPSGTHRYYFKVYALDQTLNLQAGATKKALLTAMNGHILGQGQLTGKYKR